MLHLAARSTAGVLGDDKQQLAQTVAEQLGLAVANLKLRETLRNQSIRDPLTGQSGLHARPARTEYLPKPLQHACSPSP